MGEITIIVDCVEGSEECATLKERINEVVEGIEDQKINVIENTKVDGLLTPAFIVSADCGTSQRVVAMDLDLITREFVEGIIETVTCKKG